MAFKLCANTELSKDIVQEMYLKMYEIKQKNPKKEIRDVYVWVVMCNMMKDIAKSQSKYTHVSIDRATHIALQENTFELDDTELTYLNRAKEFRYLDVGLLLENYDKGLREIEKEFKINYGFIHRTLTKTRKLILRDKYETLYKNKRLKYKKK